MSVIRIKKGLDLPIPGSVSDLTLQEAAEPARVALLPQEVPGAKAQLLVQEGDRVAVGTPLYCDRRNRRVHHVSPAAGVVEAVHRGERRKVLSIVVRVDDFETRHAEVGPMDPTAVSREELAAHLQQHGPWASLRERPYGHVAHAEETPFAIFVTAIDTEPNAVSPRILLEGREAAFRTGLTAMTRLTDGDVHLCTAADEDWFPFKAEGDVLVPGVVHTAFEGPHPAGLVGTHVHFLAPVGAERKVWHVHAQDLADLGDFLLTGRWTTRRKLPVTGPAAQPPSLLTVRPGSETGVFAGFVDPGMEDVRYVSGSLLAGRTANPGDVEGYLGRYARQLSLVSDHTEREFLGWMRPLGRRWSYANVYPAKFLPGARLRWDTDLNGSPRAIVPIGFWEELMPLDVLPTQLIKALASGDAFGAEELGALELCEEDLALCEFVDQSKTPIGALLRRTLDRLAKEYHG